LPLRTVIKPVSVNQGACLNRVRVPAIDDTHEPQSDKGIEQGLRFAYRDGRFTSYLFDRDGASLDVREQRMGRAATDFFVMPTATGPLLFVLVVLPTSAVALFTWL